MLGFVERARGIEDELLGLARELMGDSPTEEYVQEELLPFYHSAIKQSAENVYIEAIESLQE